MRKAEGAAAALFRAAADARVPGSRRIAAQTDKEIAFSLSVARSPSRSVSNCDRPALST